MGLLPGKCALETEQQQRRGPFGMCPNWNWLMSVLKKSINQRKDWKWVVARKLASGRQLLQKTKAEAFSVGGRKRFGLFAGQIALLCFLPLAAHLAKLLQSTAHVFKGEIPAPKPRWSSLPWKPSSPSLPHLICEKWYNKCIELWNCRLYYFTLPWKYLWGARLIIAQIKTVAVLILLAINPEKLSVAS